MKRPLKLQMKLQLIGIILCLMGAPVFAAEAPAPAVIPLPQKMERRSGVFKFRDDTRVLADESSMDAGRYFVDEVAKSTGFRLKARPQTKGKGQASKGSIVLTTQDANPKLGNEGYELIIKPDSVVIRAPNSAGLFYGVQTLLQLLPPEIFSAKRVRQVDWNLPCVEIEDQPRFQWRGLMLDVSRHFFTKAEVEKLLDTMALHKMNVFHWHLVDDHGWRIEIKKYPRLTEMGAWRKGVNFKLDPKGTTAYDSDGRYGGFYTQADIREVVAYAQARHITIVPEIEMPGHSTAALMAYPQLSCTGGPYTTDIDGGVFNGVYCAGNDESFTFVQDVLTEIFELFPGKYVHIGGDEVKPDNWQHCPKCQARMEAEHLKSAPELESYFIRRVEKFINARGRNLIGWSEIREGGLAQNAAVMDWIGGAVEAASAGHNVVMTPLSDCYFDHYQSEDHTKEPYAIGGFLPLKQVYAFEPVPAKLESQYQEHIMGAQANIWTEYMANLNYVEYMAFPRLSALAEVVWSPKESRNWDDFTKRLKVDLRRLDVMGVNYRHIPVEAETAAPSK
ncbi:MAG: hexosaminidase [Pedosphaera sp.]|nr:hexosaminidase [Pedosphaera sp.]